MVDCRMATRDIGHVRQSDADSQTCTAVLICSTGTESTFILQWKHPKEAEWPLGMSLLLWEPGQNIEYRLSLAAPPERQFRRKYRKRSGSTLIFIHEAQTTAPRSRIIYKRLHLLRCSWWELERNELLSKRPRDICNTRF